jgi:1,4-dihydroxy-2-naphthoate octaprenyltransferase
VNLTENKSLVFWLGNLCLATGLFGIGAIAAIQQDLMVVGLFWRVVFSAMSTKGRRFGWAIKDWAKFSAFLLLARWLSLPPTTAKLKMVRGKFSGFGDRWRFHSLILFCSHFHQVEDDFAVGKRSPIVRLGNC